MSIRAMPSLPGTKAATVADADVQRDELVSAFDLFNSLSGQLEETYRQMEQRVGSLNQELHQLAEQRLIELREKERLTQRLESLLNLLPAGVVVLDSLGYVCQCNPAARDLLGEPLMGESWRSVIQRSFSPREDDGHEISLRDGRRIGIATRSFDGEGGQLVLLTDLTETRELQRHLSRHRRLSEMGRMMSALAHQIRTPLSAAMLYAGHLSETDLTSSQVQRFSRKVLERLSHLEQQVKDMLIFAKGDLKLTDTISVNDLFIALQAAMDAPLAGLELDCRIDNNTGNTFVQCNCDAMVGALMNLVNNALQAKQSGLVLQISANRADDQLVIQIVDNGPGIAPAVADSLEEPFFTTKTQGTGLGLSVVRSIVHAHHGTFQLRNANTGGVEATITLPVLEPSNRVREGATHAL